MAALFSSCRQAPSATPELQSTDSLAQLWVDVWNAGDIDAITASFAEDALVVTDTAYTGIEDLKAGFILPAAPMLRNLSCKKLSELTGDNMAYQSGSYKHEWVVNDTVIGKAAGYYTLV
ncbi:MAG: nuclear transport factor 2 family protein [Bacteroidota bacterium]